jgi:hypothetical protein
MTGIEDVFDPTDIDIYRDLGGGLTSANVLHGSANPIGGKNQVIKLRWGKPRAEDFFFEGAMPGIKFALGENPKRPGGGAGGVQGQGPRRYPGTRMGVEYVIRDAFTRARAYQKDWQEYDRRKKAGEPTRRTSRPARPQLRRSSGNREAPRARALVSRGQDPHADPHRRRVQLQIATFQHSQATEWRRRSRRTAPARPPSPTGGATRSKRWTPSPTTPR